MIWNELSPCPGESRMNAVSLIRNNNLYVLGGIYSNYTWKYGDKKDRYMSLVDNWKYDILNDIWTRLSDNPYYLTGFSSSNNIIHNNKIILYGSVFRLSTLSNGKLIENNYSNATNIKIIRNSNYTYDRFKTCNIILTYDIETDRFDKLNSTYIINVNLPQYQIYDNLIYSTGGEVTNQESKGISVSPHTDLFVIGIIK